jgi:hypothetical protein
MNTTRVKLKRVAALRPGDRIVPGLGLFTKGGERIESQRTMTHAWGRDPYTVRGVPWMNDVPEMNVPVDQAGEGETQAILHTSLDAYVVLA